MLSNSINKIVLWTQKNGYATYDHYDFLSSKWGQFSKQFFKKNKLFGIPLVAPIIIADIYFPNIRKIFAKKRLSAEAMPYFVSGYFRLYEIEGKKNYLQYGMEILGWLKENSTRTKNGLGWGLHFDWLVGTTLLPTGTPCVTITSYSTDAFLKAYQITKKKDFLEVAKATADFVFYDLNKKAKSQETGISRRLSGDWINALESGEGDTNQISISYTPLDDNIVINANSYGAKILYDVGVIKDNKEYIYLGNKIINYILSQQNEDGSWFYFDKDQKDNSDNFIDSFHTCFVLENLFSIWKYTGDEQIKESIAKGYKFFRDHFINPDFSVRHYYSYPYPTGIKVDIRSCAEAIYCCALLSEIFPESIDLSMKITEWTINNMWDKNGYFYFRIYRTHKHKMSYMRWGEAPMFNAITFLLSKL